MVYNLHLGSKRDHFIARSAKSFRGILDLMFSTYSRLSYTNWKRNL
jgi:hypothetical protein